MTAFNTLSALQTAFQDYLLNQNKDFEQAVTGGNRSFARQRLAIYHDAYRLRLLQILKVDCPALCLWLGDTTFDKLGLSYLARYPSHFFSARDFGQYIANHLATTEPYNKTTFLAEFAAFERSLSEAIDAPNAPILASTDLAAIPIDDWSAMHLSLHPTVALLTLNWNIVDIRNNLLNQTIKIRRKHYQQPTYWMIWRHGIDVKYIQLSIEEHYVVHAFLQGMTFADICQGLSAWLSEQESAQYMVHFLQKWLPEQIFSKITVTL